MYCFNWNRTANPEAFHIVHRAMDEAMAERVHFSWVAAVLDNNLRLPHLNGLEPEEYPW